MFVDLVGSTALSSRLDPEEMRKILHAYQDAVTGEIARLGGHLAKLMGDGVLAYFGWPSAEEDDPERAVQAGLTIVQAVRRLSTPFGEPLAARVGIATGLVIVGDLIGEGAAREEAVVGETPNLAARLQEVAPPGAVVIASGTRRLLGDTFDLRDLGPVHLKGFDRPVNSFEVLRPHLTESRFEARHPDRSSPMVGRDQELALILERWRQSVAGEGQAVLVVGEAGIGKSRLVQAVLDETAEDPHIVLRYQCSPQYTGTPLWPVVQQLGFAAGFAPNDSDEQKRKKIEALLRRGTEDISEAAPLIAFLLGIEAGPYPIQELSSQQRRARTQAALIQQLLGLERRHPVLIVIEDVHWIDPTTLELFSQVLDRIANARVLMLLTSRPDNQPILGDHPHVTRLTLDRLGREPTEAIVSRLSGGQSLPPAVMKEIAARTDGVPLFIEELTKAVLETGMTAPGAVPVSLLCLSPGPARPGAGRERSGAGGSLHRAGVFVHASCGSLSGAGNGAAVRSRPAYRRRTDLSARNAARDPLRVQARPGARCSSREPAQIAAASVARQYCTERWKSTSPRPAIWSRSCLPGTIPRLDLSSRRSSTGGGPENRRSHAPRWLKRSRT